MNAKEYQSAALRTMADQQKILDRLVAGGPKLMQLVIGTNGLTNEVGEMAEAVKKHVEYGKGLDVTNIKEEVGDCFWRLRQICEAVGLTFEECMEGNIAKLAKRYTDSFEDFLAQEENRDRIAERRALEDSMAESPAPTKHNPACPVCEGIGQVGGIDASFNSSPCPKCTGAKCEHKVKEIKSNGIAVCITCREEFTEDAIMQANQDYYQNGNGWSEPMEDISITTFPTEYVTEVVEVCEGPLSPNRKCSEKTYAPSGVVNVTQPVVTNVMPPDWDKAPMGLRPTRKPLDESYSRYCIVCQISRVHIHNSVGICPTCFQRQKAKQLGAGDNGQ